jgi:hypothetical protein
MMKEKSVVKAELSCASKDLGGGVRIHSDESTYELRLESRSHKVFSSRPIWL